MYVVQTNFGPDLEVVFNRRSLSKEGLLYLSFNTMIHMRQDKDSIAIERSKSKLYTCNLS